MMQQPPGLKVDASLNSSYVESNTRLKTGQNFTLYTRDPQTQQIKSTRILLFLREGPGYGKAGTLFWSITNTLTEIPSQRLLLHMILDMRCGKLSPLFLSESLSKVVDNRCFTLRTSSIELNLEAGSLEQRDLWWKGILRKLEQAGRQLMNNNQPPPSNGTTPGSVTQPNLLRPQASLSSLSTVSASTTHAGTSPNSVSSSSSHSLSNVSPPPLIHSPAASVHESTPDELRALLHGGVVFRKWDLVRSNNSDGEPRETLHSTMIVLFAVGVGRSGSLFWIERDPALPSNAPITPGERMASVPLSGSPNRIPLDAITDFMLRKKAAPLKASPAPSDCCFALVHSSSSESLNLEAMNPQECKMAKEAIITMLTTAGKQVVKASTTSSTTNSVPNQPPVTPATPVSVSTPKQTTVSGPLPTPKTHSTQSSHSSNGGTPIPAYPSPSPSLTSHLDHDSPLLQGARFMLYSCPQDNSSAPTATEIFLWFAPPDPANGIEHPGSLCYSILSSSNSPTAQSQQRFVIYPNQRFSLATLKQMQIGRECAGFKTLTLQSLGNNLPPPFRNLSPQQQSSLLHPSCCFSIVFKTGALHLESLAGTSSATSLATVLESFGREREPVREAWIKSLHQIMLEFTKSEKARKAALAASASAALTPSSSTSTSLSLSSPSSTRSIQPSTPSTSNSTGSIHDAINSPEIPHPSLLRGIEFLLYLPSQHPQSEDDIDILPIILFLTSDQHGKYSLCYTFDTGASLLSSDEIPDSQRMALSTIQRLVAGKTTTLLKSTHPSVKDLPPERCLSIQSKTGVWNLESGNHSTREEFMKNLHQCMLKFRKPSLIHTASMPTPLHTPPAVPTAIPAHEPDFLSIGHFCRMYHSSTNSNVDVPDVVTEDVMMYFESIPFSAETLATTPGILFYVPQDPNSSAFTRPHISAVPESRRLYLNRMSQMVGGKETVVFQHPSLKRLQLDRCFSIHFAPFSASLSSSNPASLLEWNIETVTHSEREIWIQSLHSLMVKYGKEKSEFKRSGSVVLAQPPIVNGHIRNQSTPPTSNTMIMVDHAPDRVASPKSNSNFKIITPADDNHHEHEHVNNLSAPLSAVDEDESPSSDVGVTMVMATPSEIGDTKVFHSGGGLNTPSPSFSPSPSDDSSGAQPTSPKSPSTPSSPSSNNRNGHQLLETDAASALLAAGQSFTLFTSTATGDERTEIFLFFEPAFGGETPGSLFWQSLAITNGQPPDADHRRMDPSKKFVLNTIKQMRAGREAPIFQSPITKDYSNDVCMTLVNSSFSLHLAARDPEARDTFMKAVHSLVVQCGMRAKEEKSNALNSSTSIATSSSSSSQHHKSHSQPPNNAVGLVPPGPADRSHRLAINSLAAANNNKTINFQDPTTFFVLQNKIGEGSYGSVYKAIDLRDGKPCAIKIISFNGIDSSKLRNEIRVLKGCNSPYIVSYKGAFQKNEYVWCVMEHCSGGSLADMMLLCRHTFSENQISVIMKQTLLGLKYLHSSTPEKKIIIHRDIKGGNILVTETGLCKLCDFGVSGTLDESLGKHRTVIGTPHWMAPECLLSDNYNELVDIWSLGITTYELAVGQPPHAELHSLRAALKIPMCEPPSLPHPERYSPELHSFIKSCLVKDYTRRPSAAELLQHPFITNNKSTPSCLLEFVQKSMSLMAHRETNPEDIQAVMQGKPAQSANKAAHVRSVSEECKK